MPAKVPSISRCYELFLTHEAPERSIRHCLRVNQVAVYLAEALQLKGIAVDLDLVDRSSLLHNLDKHRETATAHHAELTARALRAYPKLAAIVRQHPSEAILDPARAPATIEAKIVYYADRRVMKDEIVPLETKLYRALAKQLLRGRTSLIPQLMVPLIRLEQELFAPLDITPMDLQRLEGMRENHNVRHLLPSR